MNTLVLSFVLALACTVAGQNDPLVVELANGPLRGQDNGLYYSYESIPYAEPPVNKLRLEDPVPFTGRWVKPFDATNPPTQCMQWNQAIPQPDKLTGSEDCLTISIYKPKNPSRKTFPVLAQLFCSGWSFGSSLDDSVDNFMNSGNMIVAKINYRIGALGFLSTDDNAIPGNFGLKDQQLALQWLKNNIARFGGDPENIVLFGFGTGGSSAHLQLMKKETEQLVRGAISISGTAIHPFVVQASARELAFHYGQILGCREGDSKKLKECLKKVNSGDFVSALQKIQVFDYVPFGPFSPVVEPPDVEHPFLTEMPIDTIKSGRGAQVPWLASYTTENGVYNAALLLQRDPKGKEVIEQLNTRWNELAPYFFSYPYQWDQSERDTQSQKLRRQYLGYRNFSMETYYDVQRMFTNELYKNGVEQAVDAQRRYGKSPVYVYAYNNVADRSFAQSLSKRSDIFLGSSMGDDYYLYLGNIIRGPMRADEKLISYHFIRMVENFAETGNLTYADCPFPDNRFKKTFDLVAIRRTYCEVMQVDHLPDTLSEQLPPSPKVIF